MGIEIAEISEMRFMGKGHFSTNDGYVVYFSGDEKKRVHGVAMVLSRITSKAVLGYNPVNERLISIRIQAQPMNITVIQAYAPTSDADENMTQTFYDQLQDILDNTPQKDVTIVMGDFNAKVGSNNGVNGVMGPYGLGEQNEAGQKLIDFCISNELVITNTLFKQHPRRLYTWTSPNGNTKNQIDYIMVRKRWRSSISNIKTYPGADCGSDHELLVAKMRVKLKALKHQQTVTRFDLTNITEKFKVEVKNRFHVLMEQEEEKTVDEIWNEMKSAILETAKAEIPKRKSNKSTQWLSPETLELVDQWRKIKAGGKDPVNDKKKIRTLSKEIEKQIRQDKTTFCNQQCNELERNSLHNRSKDLFTVVKKLTKKTTNQLSIVKANDGTILTEGNDIKARWHEYCEKLYARKEPADVTTELKEYDNEPDIMLSEIEKAMNKMKSGKSPGFDEIPAELIKTTGDVGIKLFHKLCNQIWSTKEWSKDWTKAVFIILPKKGDTRECPNNRAIFLISHASKIILYIMMDREQQYLEREIAKHQAGFRKGRGCRDMIANIRWIIEKFMEHKRPLYLCFIDYSKAFDTVQHQRMWLAREEMGFPTHMTELLRSLYNNQRSTVRTACGDCDWFTIR